LETHPPFDELPLPPLNHKTPGKGDGLLARITVLRVDSAGVAGQHEVFNFAH